MRYIFHIPHSYSNKRGENGSLYMNSSGLHVFQTTIMGRAFRTRRRSPKSLHVYLGSCGAGGRLIHFNPTQNVSPQWWGPQRLGMYPRHPLTLWDKITLRDAPLNRAYRPWASAVLVKGWKAHTANKGEAHKHKQTVSCY